MSELLNNTLSQWLPIWIDNMLHNRENPPRDIELAMLKDSVRNIERVCIVGTGPSFNPCFFNTDYIVTNQSSYLHVIRETGHYPHLCVITDANPKMYDYIASAPEAHGKPTVFAVATLADPKLFCLPFAYAFHHPYVRGVPFLDLLFDKLCPKSVKTNVIQVGNSMNAAMLVCAQLMLRERLPKAEMHLNGVDFAYADGTTSPQFQAYAEDNKRVVKMLRDCGFVITKEPGESPLNEWILQDEAKEEPQ